MSDQQEKNFADVLQIIGYIKENMATKDELSELKENMATKDELSELKENMATTSDLSALRTEFKEFRSEMRNEFEEFRSEVRVEFSNIHTSLSSIRRELDDIKKGLANLENRTKDDSDAAGRDFLHLQKRVEYLEKKIREFEAARS